MVLSILRRLRYIYGAPSLENFIFKLCYRWTVLLLIVFSFVITCRLLLGDSFSCSSNNDVSETYMRMKCYDDSVFTLPTKLIIKRDESMIIEPAYEDFRRYQSYYSWVNLVLLLQAFNFYLPHLLWKSYEKGFIYRLTSGVQKFFDKEEKRGLELCYLAKYVLVTQGKHKVYMLMYIFSEILNYVICLIQTLCLIHFFSVTGVPDFLPHNLGTWSDFKNFYFPSEGICEFKKFSSDRGVITQFKTLCQLPLNAFYMKIFLFLHAWYILLTILTGLVLVYRILLLVPSFRVFVSKLSSPLSEGSILRPICHSLSYSDWFFLSRLQRTMIDVDFAQMLDKIAIVSQGKDPENEDRQLSIFEGVAKDFDSLNTSPV